MLQSSDPEDPEENDQEQPKQIEKEQVQRTYAITIKSK